MRKLSLALMALVLFASPAGAQSISGPLPSAVGVAAVGQVPGTATNDNAATGKVGEYIVSTLAGPGTSIASATPTNMITQNLTAGDWDVECTVEYSSFGAVTFATGQVTTTSATITPGVSGIAQDVWATSTTLAGDIIIPTGRLRVTISSTTPVYCVARINYTGATPNMYGQFRARRVR